MMTMSQVLMWSAVLTFFMLLLASALRAEMWTPDGMQVAFGNREGLAPATGVAGRADRAAKNMVEAMVMLLAVAAAIQFSGRPATANAQLGATLFFWSRLAYWPCYLAGIIYLRTAIWFASLIGLAMMIGSIW
jgi:uncharacterized MAPEG superfamily protein